MVSIGSISLSSATILLREGLEAILIIAALSALLRKAGERGQSKALFLGALLGVIASFGAAYVLEFFFDGAHNDLLEAFIMLLAASLMFYMSGWLMMRQNAAAWQSELSRFASVSLNSRALLPIAVIAFLAVFREGGETVLFLHVLARSSGGWTPGFISGLVLAGTGLSVLFILIQLLSVRLPLRPLFGVTSALLFVMGTKQVGDAIWELQEQTLIPMHTEGVPHIVHALGLNATWEALVPQGFILLAALISFFAMKLKKDPDPFHKPQVVAE